MTLRDRSLLSFRMLLFGIFACYASSGTSYAKTEEPNSDIVVNARSREALDHFLASVAPSRNNHQLARWNGRLCVHVIGLEETHASFIKSRINEHAQSLKIRLDTDRRCEPNVVIAFTEDADGLARSLMKQYLSHNDINEGEPLHDKGPDILTNRPVRILALDQEGRMDGDPMCEAKLGTNFCFPASPFHLANAVRQNVNFVFMVVDAKQIAGINWGQLADYLTMLSLSRPSLSADYSGQDTIMDLFGKRDESRALPPGLTGQDLAFLQGLYITDSSRSAAQQRAQIRQKMEQRADLSINH